MKVYVVVLMLISSTFATRLISIDEIEGLFIKFIRNEITESEGRSLDEVIELLYRPNHVTSKQIGQDYTRSTLDCILCRSAFAALFDGVENGQSDEELSQGLTTLCTVLGVQNNAVCRGAIDLNVPIITHIVRITPEATPGTFCGLVLQNAYDSNICPIEDPRFEWQVELPAPPSNVLTPAADTSSLKIVVFTDAHIDPEYEAFGIANCDAPTCCRRGQNASRTYEYRSNVDEKVIRESIVNVNGEIMLDLDFVPKVREMKKASRTRFFNTRNSEPAGYWGDYRNCDTPIWAYDDVIDRISSTHQDIDMVYYIGDSIDHGVWETTYELINDMNLHIVEKIRQGFGDDILVVPVIGNHEAQPTNQFAPSSVTEVGLNTTWLYEGLVNKWDHYLTEDAKVTMRERGEFSILVRPGLRVISLNNNVAYKQNWWLVYDPTDSKNHLDWLIDELSKAEVAGEKVHILTHIPPGVSDLIYTWTREYNRIVNRFSSTIAAEFNGHTHSDEFKIFYSLEDDTPISVAWGAGSATSYTNYNLNYKIATFDTTTYEPTNIVNYVYNLTEANLTPNRRPHWFELYNVRNRFALTDLSAASMDNLVHSMVTDNIILLDLYAAFFSKLSDTRWPYCDDNCKLDALCKTVITVLWQREKCTQLENLYHLRLN